MSELDNVRLMSTSISIDYELAGTDEFKKEYHLLRELDNDPITQWLKYARSKGDTYESDPILLSLIVELHKKIDNLEKFLKNEKTQRLSLSNRSHIDGIGFNYFKLQDENLEQEREYYARLEMPVHPKREIGLFFVAQNSHLAKITKIHEKDEKDWNLYVSARERAMIREMRSNNE